MQWALGKDRTGVVIAVLLVAAGVERTAVLDDYVSTNDVADTILPKLADALNIRDRITSIPLAALIAEPAALAALLDHLDRDHGGAAAWLQAGGMEQFVTCIHANAVGLLMVDDGDGAQSRLDNQGRDP